MRVILFKERFRDPILSGVKTSTIRKKARCRAGDTLSLRCWTGKPYRSKQMTFATRICTGVMPVVIGEGHMVMNGIPVNKAMREALAVTDGFERFRDMEDFFKETHGLPFTGEMIQWGKEVVTS